MKYNYSAMLASFQRGEEKAFDFFFRKLFSPLCFFANRIINNKFEAEDIASNAFIKIWTKHEIFNDENSIRSYLYRIVKNDCLKAISRNAKAIQLHKEVQFLTTQTDNETYESEIIRAEFYSQLYEAIKSLPGQCKEIMRLLYSEGKTVNEIAEELNLSKSTVKTQKVRGIQALRKRSGLLSILLLYLN